MTSFNTTKKIVVSALFSVMLLNPALVSANQVDYDTLSLQGKIIYLLGMVDQLQALLILAEDEEDSLSDSDSRVEVATLSVTDVEDDEAQLRGQVDLERDDEVTVWFEYGEDNDDLDDDTSKRTLRDNDGQIQTFSRTIDDLDDDERYYFRAVVEDEDGDRDYGDIKTFTTDDDNKHSSNDDDFDLDLSDRSIDEGDRVTIEWTIPEDDTGIYNWIGLYEVGDDNEEYIDWVYLDRNEHEGSDTFRINDSGDYEFRIFLDNSYDDEYTSREIEVD